MKVPFNPMDVLDNTSGNSFLSGPVRVLAWPPGAGTDVVWLIDLPRMSATKSNQRKGYTSGPYSKQLAELVEALAESRIHVLKLQPDPKMSMKDEDRLAACVNDDQRKSLRSAFDKRDRRYNVIKPLVADSTVLLSLATILEDASFGIRLAERANALTLAKSTLYNWLHRFWSGGCQKNALLSNYERCGNPGLAKPQKKKLGRGTRLFKQGLVDSRGYPLSQMDKTRLAWGYRLINHSMRPRDAYLVTCATHWAEHVLDDHGNVRALMFEKHLRPTFSQFKWWGQKLVDKTVTQMLLGPTRWRQKTVSQGGSEQDSVVAVGQQSMFDGTTTDVYLVSYCSRLKKLPPLTRLILKESRVGLIYGVYCGWEEASPQTALQAICHGAMPCKMDWGARFGALVPKGAIPGLLARNHLADNGELKAEKATEAEQQFGFGLDCTPTMSGDRKGGIETQHHSDHAHLDKRLPGATHGKRRERGQDHPATAAILNYYEYMKELIEHIVWHNTVQEVPDLAPDDMLLAEPPIKLTRINIYEWLTAQGMNVSLPVDYEALRAFTLPDVDAVVRKNGIYLEASIHGRKELLPRLRYTSAELVATNLLSQVKQTGTPLHVRMKMDPTDLSQAWLPTKAGMVRVTTSARDKTILTKLTLGEWIMYREQQVNRKDLAKGAAEQSDADTVLRRLAIIETATKEAEAEIRELGKRPSKTKLTGNLDKNRADELKYLQDQEKSHFKSPPVPPAASPEPVELELSAADRAMNAYHAQMESA